MVMAEMDPSIGVTGDINSSKTNAMALLEQVEGFLAKVGLSINAQKCSSLRAEVQRKNNRWIVN